MDFDLITTATDSFVEQIHPSDLIEQVSSSELITETVQGPEGAKGDKGDQGDQGIQGEQGIQGIQGLKGDQGIQGFQGVKGDQGDRGFPGAAAPFYVHDQTNAMPTWVIDHPLSKFPSVTCMDSAGDEIEGILSYDSLDRVTMTFGAATGGKAYLN